MANIIMMIGPTELKTLARAEPIADPIPNELYNNKVRKNATINIVTSGDDFRFRPPRSLIINPTRVNDATM